MMNILPSGSVSISKGDTGRLTVQFTSDTLLDDTEALVTLKENVSDKCALWEKRFTVADKSISIQFESADTNFSPGRYYWDIRLIKSGEIITPTTPRTFTILEVVGSV